MADERTDRPNQDLSKKDRNYKYVKKKTTNFFSAPQETYYDRALDLNFLSRYYRELCLTAMGICMCAFGLAMTIVAIERGIPDLYIIGPAPLCIGILLIIFAIGFTVKRWMDRPRIGLDIDFVESPDKLFLQKRVAVLGTENEANPEPAPPKPGTSAQDNNKPKSCLRRTSTSIPANPLRNSPNNESQRKPSYAEFPASPISTLPEVCGGDGESVRSTPERPSTADEEVFYGAGYPAEGALVCASPIDVLPPAEYISPPEMSGSGSGTQEV